MGVVNNDGGENPTPLSALVSVKAIPEAAPDLTWDAAQNRSVPLSQF